MSTALLLLFRRFSTATPAAALALSLVVAGCAAATSGGDGGPVDASLDSTPATLCPSALPAAGGACPRLGLVCEFGDDPRVSCRPRATCNSVGWTLQSPSCPALSACPDPGDGAANQACSTMNAQCGYGALACTCTNCGPPYPVQRCDGPTTWHCAPAPGADTAACPTPIANLGTPCATESQLCRYDCEGMLARTCEGGIWVSSPQPNQCPISTRSAKRDLRYLAPDELEHLALEVEGTRLATYEYLDPAQPAGRHLGFIIEDQPADSPAVAADRGHVDLYGYTSMLVAALQSQRRELTALRGELAAVRAQLATLPVAPPRARAPRTAR